MALRETSLLTTRLQPRRGRRLSEIRRPRAIPPPLHALYIVRDPLLHSTLSDIFWAVDLDEFGERRLDDLIRNSPPNAMVLQRWSFFTSRTQALAESFRRLIAREATPLRIVRLQK